MTGAVFSDPGALSASKCEESRQRIPSGTAVNTADMVRMYGRTLFLLAITERLLGKSGATM